MSQLNEWNVTTRTHQLISWDLLRIRDGLHPRRHSFLDDNNDNTHNIVHIYMVGPYASHHVRYQFRVGTHVISMHDSDGNILDKMEWNENQNSQ